MRAYSTCVACQAELDVTTPGQTLHPGCAPPPGSVEALTADYLHAVAAGDHHQADTLRTALDNYDHRPPRLLDAALAYAAWGWPVFPCRSGHKLPATPREEGGKGLLDATTDAHQIRQWWARWPSANVATATGGRFDVIDVDPGGFAAWADIRDTLDLAIHGQVSTPRGGLHIYIQPTGDGNLAGLAPGVDYRGRGGYVLLPPSVLVPAALKNHPVPDWPLRYSWWTRPSPRITGGRSGHADEAGGQA